MNRPIKDLIQTRRKLIPEWSAETQDFVDELYSRLEYAEIELEVFNLRLKGEWTPNSKLYTEKELDDATNEAYNQGYKDGTRYFYGTTSADEKFISNMAKNIPPLTDDIIAEAKDTVDSYANLSTNNYDSTN